MDTFHEWLRKSKVTVKNPARQTEKSPFAQMAQISRKEIEDALSGKDDLKIQQYLTPEELERAKKNAGIAEPEKASWSRRHLRSRLNRGGHFTQNLSRFL
jgi:hypothetical protein